MRKNIYQTTPGVVLIPNMYHMWGRP